jgi:hypothetical protein
MAADLAALLLARSWLPFVTVFFGKRILSSWHLVKMMSDLTVDKKGGSL